MDVLTDLFREAGLRRRLINLFGLPATGAFSFPCERSVGFHVVLNGPVFLHADALSEPLRLESGDIAVMGRRSNHLLSTNASLDGVAVECIAPVNSARSGILARHPSARASDVTLVSGAYQLWNPPVHPFFAELPSWFVLRADQTPRFEPLSLAVAMLTTEAERDDETPDALGRDTVVHGLLDVLFTFLLREMVARRGAATAGWSQAVRDPLVRRAVALLHEDSARDWTLEILAREAGTSRSVLAERFRSAMGDTPLAYLRTLRMQRAMRLLSEGDQTLESIAASVGYQDAFGFSKAFKRATGESPGGFRKRNAIDRLASWRFNETEAISTG